MTKGRRGQEQDLRTVTVQGSWTVARADGATAFVLDTPELGAIAFVVTLKTLPRLREEFERCAEILARPTGSA
jgi:hypothetical protein